MKQAAASIQRGEVPRKEEGRGGANRGLSEHTWKAGWRRTETRLGDHEGRGLV